MGEVVGRVLPALGLMVRATPTPTIVTGVTDTATILVPATMTLERATLSTTVAPRAPRGLGECPTQPTPTKTRATPTPSTSNRHVMLLPGTYTAALFSCVAILSL